MFILDEYSVQNYVILKYRMFGWEIAEMVNTTLSSLLSVSFTSKQQL